MPLRPSDIPPIPLFTNWIANHTTAHNGVPLAYSEGTVEWQLTHRTTSRLLLVTSMLSRPEVASIISLANASAGVSFDTELDTVDGMTAHEIHLSSEAKQFTPGTEDNDPATRAKRQPVRDALLGVLQPIIDNRITPFVRRYYATQCNRSPERACTPCSSLIRRYRAEDRTTHSMHRDGEGFVTVVISLSDHGSEFHGGLYASNGTVRHTLALQRGDAVVHQHDLLHGVEVNEQDERWSLIIWFKDAADCSHHGHEWGRTCAEAGDAICQLTHGIAMHRHPELDASDRAISRVAWMTRAAEGGSAQAAFKLGWSHMRDREMPPVLHWLWKAHTAGEADASYALAWLLLQNATSPDSSDAFRAVALLEESAALGASPHGGAVKAMYNLGIAHLYGYGVVHRNHSLAMEWFQASRLPEGYFAVALGHRALDATGLQTAEWDQRARRLGFGTQARRVHQSAGGFDLHIWPASNLASGPPRW